MSFRAVKFVTKRKRLSNFAAGTLGALCHSFTEAVLYTSEERRSIHAERKQSNFLSGAHSLRKQTIRCVREGAEAWVKAGVDGTRREHPAQQFKFKQ